MLRGRDIQRYRAEWKGLWLIYARKGIDIERYPAVHQHLEKHREALSRKAGNNKWYELQASPSDRLNTEFAKEKLVWIELVNDGRFAYDNNGFYSEATTFLLTGESIKYFCAVLNSKLIRWFLASVAPTSGMGTLRWKKAYVERLPILRISTSRQRPLAEMVDRVLKAAGDASGTDEIVQDIDQLVYGLYGLTEAEIAEVEERLRPTA